MSASKNHNLVAQSWQGLATLELLWSRGGRRIPPAVGYTGVSSLYFVSERRHTAGRGLWRWGEYLSHCERAGANQFVARWNACEIFASSDHHDVMAFSDRKRNDPLQNQPWSRERRRQSDLPPTEQKKEGGIVYGTRRCTSFTKWLRVRVRCEGSRNGWSLYCTVCDPRIQVNQGKL